MKQGNLVEEDTLENCLSRQTTIARRGRFYVSRESLIGKKRILTSKKIVWLRNFDNIFKRKFALIVSNEEATTRI